MVCCARCSSGIPGWLASSRPATRSGLTPWPWLRPLQAAGFHGRDAGLAFFLLVDYTIGFAVSGTPPPPTSNGSAIRRPEANCIGASAHSPLTGSPPWSPWASTSGWTTGTSGSTLAWRRWLPGWSTPASHQWRGARAGTIKDARRPEGRWMNDPQDLNRPDKTHSAPGHYPS
jgi:hypothetical protein